MSNISNALTEELLTSKKTAADLSRACGMTEAQISRLKSGYQKWIGEDTLIGFATALYPAKSDLAAKCHARLLYAHLLDEYVGPGAKFIELKLNLASHHTRSKQTEKEKPVLSPDFQQDLDTLIANSQNKDVRNAVASIAAMCPIQSAPRPLPHPPTPTSSEN